MIEKLSVLISSRKESEKGPNFSQIERKMFLQGYWFFQQKTNLEAAHQPHFKSDVQDRQLSRWEQLVPSRNGSRWSLVRGCASEKCWFPREDFKNIFDDFPGRWVGEVALRSAEKSIRKTDPG